MKKEIIIQRIINRINAKTYLEIGVQRGKNFFQISADHKIAVDPAFIFGIKRRILNVPQFFKHSFFEETSDLFFRHHAEKAFGGKSIDVAFIDGLHTYKQSLIDFENCMKYLSAEGIIIFHDCNPTSESAAASVNSPKEMLERYPDAKVEWLGDVWKTIVHLRSIYQNLEVFVLDCDYGVGIVRKGKPENTLRFTENQIAKLSYADLNSHRVELLNLKNPDYLSEFLNRI